MVLEAHDTYTCNCCQKSDKSYTDEYLDTLSDTEATTIFKCKRKKINYSFINRRRKKK